MLDFNKIKFISENFILIFQFTMFIIFKSQLFLQRFVYQLWLLVFFIWFFHLSFDTTSNKILGAQ